MKKIILSVSLLLNLNAFSQIITETVNFDNYVSTTSNDLTNNFINNFSPTNPISQTNSNGISGGALVPPNSVSWGNDKVQYCSTYKNTLNSLLETSVSFKYNSSLINPNSYQRSAVIWLRGDSGNHDVGFYLNKDLTLSITSYNYAQNTQISLTNGHWYKLVGQYKSVGGSFGDQVFAKAEIFDLGTSGTNTPVSIGNHTATIYDIDLVSSTKFIIEMSGAKWGGAEYLDNFVFKGEKNGTICSSLGINENNSLTKNLSIYPNPSKGIININLEGSKFSNNSYELQLINSLGQQVYKKTIRENLSSIDLSSSITEGVYMVILKEKEGGIIDVQKIIIE